MNCICFKMLFVFVADNLLNEIRPVRSHTLWDLVGNCRTGHGDALIKAFLKAFGGNVFQAFSKIIEGKNFVSTFYWVWLRIFMFLLTSIYRLSQITRILTCKLIRPWEMWLLSHYNDVIMSAMASQITSLTIVYSTVHSGADQRKHQSSASLAFVRGIHRWPVNSPHKRPVTRKMFPFDDVIIWISNFQIHFKDRYDILSMSSEIDLRWMPQDLTDD